jgi:hypothetical protein
MRNSFVKINKNDILFCGRTNAEIGIFVRYKAICDNFETDALTWEQICANFDRKERKVVSKLVRISSEVNPKLDEVNPKLIQSKTEVEQSKTEVNPKFGTQEDNKNNDLACARVYNIPDETRLDETRRDYISADAPNKQYAFEGKIIKLKQKDFDAWKLAYPDLNLRAELLQRDIWLQAQPPEEQKKWFLSTSQFFIKQNERRKAQNADIAEQYGTANKPENDNVCWF